MITSKPLRVRIHLNLAKPHLAENVVKIRSPETNNWITAGYATELSLENCSPIIELKAQERIKTGKSKKTPHAFIEGDLMHFKGRVRQKAPEKIKQLANTMPSLSKDTFVKSAKAIRDNNQQINYNPRFASCFYLNNPDKTKISEKFLGCKTMISIGWGFWVKGATFVKMKEDELFGDRYLENVKISEKIAIKRGLEMTNVLNKKISMRVEK